MADYEEYGWSSGDEDKARDEGKGEEDLECDPEIDAFLASVLAGADENERCMLTGEKRPSEEAQPGMLTSIIIFCRLFHNQRKGSFTHNQVIFSDGVLGHPHLARHTLRCP